MAKKNNIMCVLHEFKKKSSIYTKISFIVMGAGNFARKQIIKGLLFLLIEIAFLVFMFTNGVEMLKGLITLGTKTQGFEYDEALGFSVSVAGDNSMIMLIYGICAIGIIILSKSFIAIMSINIPSDATIRET